GQQMTAAGPGRIGMFDKATKKRSINAAWKDILISTKEGNVDVLTLQGDASFQDLEHEQYLNADELKVWLEPSGGVKAAPAPANNPNAGSRRPQRVEARRNVVTRSPEMHIHDTDTLILTFKDAPPGAQPSAPGPKPSSPTPPTSKPPMSKESGQ